MGQVSSYDINPAFIWECFKLYWGDGWIFPVLMAAALLVVLLRMKKTAAMLLFWCTLILCVTIYNPLFIHVIVPEIVEKETYYRTFWMLPVIPGAAWLGTWLFNCTAKKWVRCACMIVLLGIVVTRGGAQANVQSLELPSTVYKVPRALVWATDKMHTDFEEHKEEIQAFYKEQKGKDNAPKRPYAVYGGGLADTARQYDPAVRMAIKRNTQLLFYGSTVLSGSIKQKKYRRARVILNQLSGFQSVSVEEFREAMVNKYITYIVIYENAEQRTFLESCGLDLIGAKYGYQLYRFLPKEEYLTEYALWKEENK